jgi:hypothetical protein
MNIYTKLREAEQECKDKGYDFLGWQVGLDNEKRNKCYSLGHKPKDIQHTPRGSDCTFWCDTCKIYWKIDMSD